jgi:hypothetical protein
MTVSAVTADGRARVLADGNQMPMLGLGVWQVPNGVACVNAVRWALDLGYRHIDTAAPGRRSWRLGIDEGSQIARATRRAFRAWRWRDCAARWHLTDVIAGAKGTRAVESGHPRASRSADKLGWMLCGRARIACVSSTAFRPDDVFTMSTSSS